MQSQVHIGVDVGTERTGLAISDEHASIALPLETVDAKDAAARVLELIDEREAIAIVVGWPLELTGRAGRAVKRVESFIDALESLLGDREVPIHKVDERLTTAVADAALRETNVKGKRRGKVIDQVAATQILQGYLDSIRSFE